MKRSCIIFSVFLLLLSSCTNEASTSSGGINSGTINSSIVDTQRSILTLQPEEIFDLLGKPLDDVFAVLGDNHDDPDAYEGRRNVAYDDCDIFFNDLRIVEDIWIQQRPYVFYKGISNGKTLEEINANPELKTKLTLQVDPEQGNYFAAVKFPYKSKYIYIELDFDDDANGKCRMISIGLPIKGYEDFYENIPEI
ncbi:MAG: hypothetical protein FWE62_06375 [Firmicutes bacterium]|nr:hypothetical protein [Bacillota bacterium]